MPVSQQHNSIVKALNIIEDLAMYGPSSLTALSRRLELDKGTVHRTLAILRERGFVEQRGWDRHYLLTERLSRLGSLENRREELLSITRPVLERLSAKFQETVHVAAYVENGQAVSLDTIEGIYGAPMRLMRSSGSTLILHASSLGKCLLAFAGDEVIAEVLPKLKYDRFTPTTIGNARDFRRELSQVRYQGYALDDGETRSEMFCVGGPVFDRHGEIWAAVSVSGPRERMLYKKHEVIKDLKQASRELSLSCGMPEDLWRLVGD